MYEILQGVRDIDDKKVTTFTRTIYSANILEVEAGSNGLHGGDAGHGARAYIRVKDLGGTCMEVEALKDKFDSQGVVIKLAGDCEIQTMIEALDFISQCLKDSL